MPVNENLTVPYHQQDTSYYCGAACAEMVLDSIGAGLLDQDDLYTDVRDHTAELASWYTAPDGLQWVMNDRRPAAFGGWFALYSLGSEDLISRKLVWTIHHYKVAPIALVQGGNHWVVVRGYEASAAPSDGADVSYTIGAFEVNDPWPPVPSASGQPPPQPPPHGGSDGCGSGGNRGTANAHIAYGAWQSTYMTANAYGSLWKGQYVAVCDPDPPADRPGARPPAPRRARGDTLLDPRAAVTSAAAGLRQFELARRKGWERALDGTRAGTPALVQRLDRDDSFYYIVPFLNREKAISAAVAVDARFGDYLQAVAPPADGAGLLAGLDRRAIQSMIVGHRFELEGRRGRLLVRKEAFCQYPTLVWRSCLESLSPFFPFHMITVGDHRLYIRVDGRVFTTLHTDIPGV